MLSKIYILVLYIVVRIVRFFDFFIQLIPVKTNCFYDCIIIRTDGVGDFIIWADVAREFSEKYNNILYICPKSYYQLAVQLDLFTDIWPVDTRKLEYNLAYNIRYMCRLKRLSATNVYNPMQSHLSVSDFMIGMIQSNSKIGIEVTTKSFWSCIKAKYYTSTVLIEGKSIFSVNQCFLQKTINVNYRAQIADFRNICHSDLLNLPPKYCFIGLSSSVSHKIWPVERVLDLLYYIPEKYAVVLSGYGKQDEIMAKYIIDNYKGCVKIINSVNKTDILQMLNQIANSSFVLGNDSAAIHFAAACRVRSICYSGGMTYEEFVPYPHNLDGAEYHPRIIYNRMVCFGCHGSCHKRLKELDVYPCLEKVTKDMVVKEINKVVKEID